MTVPIVLKQKLTTAHRPEEALAKLSRHFVDAGASVEDSADDGMTVREGSRLMYRILGSGKDIPLWIDLEVTETNHGSEVELVMTSNEGPYLLLRSEAAGDAYDLRFQSLIDELSEMGFDIRGNVSP